jgi:hypothetical protein
MRAGGGRRDANPLVTVSHEPPVVKEGMESQRHGRAAPAVARTLLQLESRPRLALGSHFGESSFCLGDVGLQRSLYEIYSHYALHLGIERSDSGMGMMRLTAFIPALREEILAMFVRVALEHSPGHTRPR